MTLPAPVTRLVIAYAFAPFADTSGIVATKRVRLRGEPVDVIQNDLASMRARDDSLEVLCEELVDRRAVLSAPARFGGWKSILRFCELGEDRVREWEAEGREYLSLYTRAHFSASHLLGALLRAERPQLRWEAEFSDPLSRTVDGRRRPGPVLPGPLLERMEAILASHGVTAPDGTTVFEWIEILTYTLADELLFTNEAQVETACQWAPLPELVPQIRAKAVVSHHPTVPERFYTMATPQLVLEPDKVCIGYFGNVAAGPGVGTVVTAISLLPEHVRQRIQFYLFTHHHAVLTERARKLGIDDTVVAGPFVPYLEMLALSRSMDLLLVSDHARPTGQARNPFLLAKWSDYRGSGTPVWGLVDAGSTLSEQELAYSSPLGHVTAAMQVLAMASTMTSTADAG